MADLLGTLRRMATTRPRPDNSGTTKPEETKTAAAPAAPVPPAIPCVGPGPLGGHPVPSGATHFRIHSCDGTGRLGVALVLGHDDEGGPITRAPVALMGDARWWDVWPPGGGFVRLVFARVHGDQVLARMGSGPLWVPKNRREGTAAPSAEAAPAAPQNPVLASPDGSLFTVLLQLQAMADSRAKLEIAAVREASQQQRQADRDFMRSMSELMVGARREERRDVERSTRRQALDIADAARAAVAEAHELDREDRAEDEPEEQKIAEQADLIGRALSGLGDSVKPILSELARRAANGNLPGGAT